MNYLFLITGILIGLFIGLIIGMFTILWGIGNSYLKDYYYLPYKPCDRDLYAIKDGKLERKPLPHKDFIDEAESYQTEEEYKAYVSGWNECLDEIIGDEE